MITKYLISNKQNQGLGTIGYNANGVLVYFNFAGFKTAEQVDWMLTKLPMREVAVIKTIEKLSQYKLVVSKAELDLSFENAYNKFAYKHGKDKAIIAYGRMNEKQKIAFFNSLPAYHAHLAKTGTASTYMATYINQKRYEDEH